MADSIRQTDFSQPSAGSLQFWQATWDRHHTPWQLKNPNPILVKHYDRLFPTGAPARVLIPLCGKTVDLIHLWEKGHEVIGIEGVGAAITAFSDESGIELNSVAIGEEKSKWTRHETTDGRLAIMNGNFFDISHPTLNETFTVVWDRASLYAVDPDARLLYVETIKRLVSPIGFKYLLTTLEYDGSLISGPPHSILQDEIVKLFGEFANIERVEEVEMTFELQKFKEKGVKVKEVVYLLTSRST